MSSRLGSSTTVPENVSGERSSHPGTPRARAVSTEALICSLIRLFSLIATTWPLLTRYAGIVTFYEDFPYAWWNDFVHLEDLPPTAFADLPSTIGLVPGVTVHTTGMTANSRPTGFATVAS